jgi:hypothetical protein
MLILPQKVNVNWHSKNKEYYVSIGYPFTKMGDTFEVNVKDLSKGTLVDVLVSCDYCKEKYYKDFRNYTTQNLDPTHKDCCIKCISNKKEEIMSLKSTEEKVLIYKKVLNSDLKGFPDKFFNDLSSEDIKGLVFCFVDKLKDDGIINKREDILNVINKDLFIKYKLVTLTDNYGIYNILEIAFDGYFKPWEFNKSRVPSNYWSNEENIEMAMNWLKNKLYISGIVSDDKDFLKLNFKNIMEEYNLYSIYLKFFNSSNYNIINYLFPFKYKEWQLKTVPKNFYKSDENKKEIMEWLVSKLIEDRKICSIEDIPKIVSQNLFKEYGLFSFLANCFNLSPYQSFNFLYPHKWMPWEFQQVPSGYWNEGNNVRIAIDWFINKVIDDKLVSSVKDIAKLPVNKLLNEYRLGTLTVKFNDIGFLFSFAYSNTFNHQDFINKVYSEDGERFDSRDEVLIHQFLKKEFKNVKYFYNNVLEKNKWFNIKTNENYVPDWIINNNIIVEYFGWYNEKSENETFKGYREKTKRKIDYFSELPSYKFVAVYPSDLKNDLEGLKSKLSTIK